jgi:hypothetical protein
VAIVIQLHTEPYHNTSTYSNFIGARVNFIIFVGSAVVQPKMASRTVLLLYTLRVTIVPHSAQIIILAMLIVDN